MKSSFHTDTAPTTAPQAVIEGVSAETLFFPAYGSEAIDALLDTVWRRRQRRLLVLSMQVLERFPGWAAETGFDAAVAAYRSFPQPHRQAYLDHPPFRSWLNLIGRLPLDPDRLDASQRALILQRMRDFVRLQEDARHVLGKSNGRAPFTLQRYEVDPLIAEVAPPSYLFEDLGAKKAADAASHYTLGFFDQVLATTLAQIRHAWPEMAETIPRFVKIVIHLPDVEFRSARLNALPVRSSSPPTTRRYSPWRSLWCTSAATRCCMR